MRRLGCALAAVLAVASVAACTNEPEQAPVLAPGRPGEPASTIPPGEVTVAPAAPPNAADVTFVRDMIVHHQQAVEMTRLVPERAAGEALKRLADRFAGAQAAEIGMMNSWLRTHGQPTVDPEHTGHGGHAGMPGMATPAQLESLRAARGPDFDRLFLDLMITHHQGALTMAGEIQNKGADVRVQEIADDVSATQLDEINTMRAMRGS